MRPAAAITMVYNERDNFPRWLRHYSSQVGVENCFVIDHGSDDDTFAIPPTSYSLIRLPRTPFDAISRAALISDFASMLAPSYKYVICVDADELIIADPARYTDLALFCSSRNDLSINSIGYDVCHRKDEGPLDRDGMISTQRRSMRFNSAMCKPNIARPGVRWSPGFHGSQNGLKFDDVYLFHTHWADKQSAMQRLQVTRTLQRTDPYADDHWRARDEVVEGYLNALSAMSLEDSLEIGSGNETIRRYLDKIIDEPGSHEEKITPPLDLLSEWLFTIPVRFRGRF